MGFKSVFRCLQEVFPQIDVRILKAVAIEHSKDADAAVNDILTDVLPHLGSGNSTFPVIISPNAGSFRGAESSTESGSSSFEHVEDNAGANGTHADITLGVEIEDSGISSKLISPSHEDGEYIDFTNGALHADGIHLNESMNGSNSSSSDIKNDGDNKIDLYTNEIHKEIALELDQADRVLSKAAKLIRADDEQECTDTGFETFFSPNLLMSIVSSDQSQFGVSTEGLNDSLKNPSFEVEKREYFMANVHDEDQARSFSSLTSQKDCSVASKTGSIQDDISENSSVLQSNEISRIDILDEIIEDAKNNKKTLFSAMESVINMMKEVEIQESNAERAKEEAALGGLDILIKVEELKQMLEHAKEANSMQAGEVYGEKAILATEVRELQSRLLCLSDEKDKSLATLDEMRKTLEVRLAVAEDLKKAAEQEKLEKEESARISLAEQEEIMENVVQEAKLIAQAADENSKLREFLMNRGRILDTLQGEISVICQDVSLLKEKFDKRLPLSMSVSSSQTSCKLASSGSSMKSLASALIHEEDKSSKKPDDSSPGSSIIDVPPISRAEENNMKKQDQNELSEDGWDIIKDADTETWMVKMA
ncbi:uncharacterized protein LOC133792228 [Humulus lupulus]|uniref:uncharacterized protein LOC133792228 n=1 Tax=Humulus lupulus TaxID=3486 RepID=UPI002B408E1C|nr:uncharacterized protein LOC133792228 [Humulus lupulus]